MPISNIEENLELARNRLVELDRKERTTEESTTEESTTTAEESSKIVIFIRGEVIAYEIPSPVHASVAAILSHLLLLWSNRHLVVYSELDITVGTTSEYCTDIAAEPRQTPPPTPGSVLQPTIIIEVARTETLNSLDSLTVPNPALNVPNPPPNTPPMITLANTTPNLAISFGTAPLNHQSTAFINNTGISIGRLTGFLQCTDIACTAAGMQNYQITIPANLLFMPQVVPTGVPNNFTIDLWEVQQEALYHL
ncbi:hypothetical protein F8M41_009106 [Gigaspora margarita]|uniref:Uncharacterized protein n=1 Tax=Gigaspora margarita TaxID=4874 RepID=A0A8H3X3C8_GIGMA|nr:hypothetical protein F8M41_009106 [Gigaspora margarita]